MMKYTKGDYYIVPNKKVTTAKTPIERSVYFAICARADENGICWPSHEMIAYEAGCSRRSVIDAINKLIEYGLLSKTVRKSTDSKIQETNVYQINVIEEPSATVALGAECKSRQNPSAPYAQELHPLNYKQVSIEEKPKKEQIEIPKFIDPKVWSDWERVRKEKRNSLTPTVIKKQLEFLEKNKENANEIILQSIQNGWTGLFPLKNTYKKKELSNILKAPPGKYSHL